MRRKMRGDGYEMMAVWWAQSDILASCESLARGVLAVRMQLLVLVQKGDSRMGGVIEMSL